MAGDEILADLTASYGSVVRSLIVTTVEPSPVTLIWTHTAEDDAVRLRVSHRCDRGARGIIICAPEIRLDPEHHQIDNAASAHPTITPSILCDDCGLHGFVREGKWVPA